MVAVSAQSLPRCERTCSRGSETWRKAASASVVRSSLSRSSTACSADCACVASVPTCARGSHNDVMSTTFHEVGRFSDVKGMGAHNKTCLHRVHKQCKCNVSHQL